MEESCRVDEQLAPSVRTRIRRQLVPCVGHVAELPGAEAFLLFYGKLSLQPFIRVLSKVNEEGKRLWLDKSSLTHSSISNLRICGQRSTEAASMGSHRVRYN